MDRILSKGSKQSHDLKSLFDNAPHSEINETLGKLDISLDTDFPSNSLKEIIIPSEDQRPSEDWIKDETLVLPSKSKQFTKWPIDVSEESFYVCFHARNHNKTEEFWATIRREDNKNICWFELIKSTCLPWFSISVTPEVTLDDDYYNMLADFSRSHIPTTLQNVVESVTTEQIMVEYTFCVDKRAFTVVDLGTVLPLSSFLLKQLQDIKSQQLLPLLESAVSTIRKGRIMSYEDFRPRTA